MGFRNCTDTIEDTILSSLIGYLNLPVLRFRSISKEVIGYSRGYDHLVLTQSLFQFITRTTIGRLHFEDTKVRRIDVAYISVTNQGVLPERSKSIVEAIMKMHMAGKADILHFRMMGQTVAKRQEIGSATLVMHG